MKYLYDATYILDRYANYWLRDRTSITRFTSTKSAPMISPRSRGVGGDGGGALKDRNIARPIKCFDAGS